MLSKLEKVCHGRKHKRAPLKKRCFHQVATKAPNPPGFQGRVEENAQHGIGWGMCWDDMEVKQGTLVYGDSKSIVADRWLCWDGARQGMLPPRLLTPVDRSMPWMYLFGSCEVMMECHERKERTCLLIGPGMQIQ